jgi:pimeloyl-ACP methyl ester carboxylesterase
MDSNQLIDIQTQEVDSTLSNSPENDLNKNISKPKTKKSMVKKVLLYIFGTLGVLLLLYILLNVICLLYEKHKVKSYNYGTTVNVNGHKMNINTVGESNEPTIVFLTGYIVPSPVIYYKPLTELLSKTYKVITIEPFGYGLSDIVDEERTIENIVPELHSCVEQLNIKNYYLMAHSLGGMYSLYYANQYPNEVIGFIGFDTTVPKIAGNDEKIRNSINSSVKKYYWFNFFGLNRMMSLFNNSNLIVPLPVKVYNYSDEEISMFRNVELAKGSNKNIVDEAFQSIHGLDVIDNMKFPKNITLLHFDSSKNTKSFSNYEQLHKDVGSESLSNEVISLEGGHGDFLFKHNDIIVSKLNDFIKK